MVRMIAGVLRDGLLTFAKRALPRWSCSRNFRTSIAGSFRAFTSAGYARIPSMPMTRLNIAYNDFEDYLTTALSKNTRKNLRRENSAMPRQADRSN